MTIGWGRVPARSQLTAHRHGRPLAGRAGVRVSTRWVARRRERATPPRAVWRSRPYSVKVGAMRTVEISGLTVRPSALGYGCALLMDRGRRHARRLLAAAFDAGIRHFDVAPLYGQGEAEPELGKFARFHRREITLTTKVGLLPAKSNWIRRGALFVGRRGGWPILSLARAAKGLRPKLRGVPVPDGAAKFTMTDARVSLDNSLRALRTDYIDILLLHEYEPASDWNGEIQEFLDEAIKAGKIRRFGLGSTFQRTLATLRVAPGLCDIVQFESSALTPNVAAVREVAPASVMVTHGALSESYRRVAGLLARDRGIAEELAKTLDLDVAAPAIVSRLMLACALAANPLGVVLFASTQAGNIANNAKAANGEFSSEQIDRFEKWLAGYRSELLG